MQTESKGRESRGVGDLAREIEEQWPSLKYLSLGCYYAWIFLCYSSQVLEAWAGVESFVPKFSMYISSTIALTVTLVLAAVFHRRFERLLERRRFVMLAALLASLATAALAYGLQSDPEGPIYHAGCVLTGVGTALIALRIGTIYGSLSARKALMLTSVSFLFATMIYFVCIGVPAVLGLDILTLLPLIAAVLTLSFTGSGQRGVAEKSAESPAHHLPHGFLVRLVLATFVFSLAASFASGGAHSAVGLSSVSDDGSIAMFLIGLVAIVVFIISGVLSARFDLVRLYYPLILLASISLFVIPVTGGHLEGHGLLPTVVYNVFIMFIWVLLSHVSDRTQLSAVQVFGWGRGASALGTTVGNVLAMEIQTASGDPTNMMVVASVALLFALAATAMVVLKEGALDDMFAKTGGDTSQGFSALLDPFAQDAALAGKGSWMRSCEELADETNLSKREREVLVLLSKGRTIEFIAEDLGISFNTSKSHVRHVYEKTGVHTRQELLSLIETRRNAMRV